MSKIEVNQIIPQSGTTLTIGETGDTISFASGVLPSLESLTITGDLTVDTDTLYVDSANNEVGIGTSSPAGDLHVYDSDGDCNLILQTGGTNSQVGFGDNADNFVGKIQYNHTSNYMGFVTNGSERMRIDSSGNVGIGTTSPSAAIDFGTSRVDTNGYDTGAIRLFDNGVGDIYGLGISSNQFNFRTSDRFVWWQDTTERMRIDNSGHLIVPNGVTLGTAAGTYNANNTLDDYEEGTWTADVYIGGDSTGTTRTGYYTKIGNLVTYTVGQMNPSKGALTGDIEVRGLPFTSANVTGNLSNGSIRWDGLNTGGTLITFINQNQSRIAPQIYNTTDGYVDDLDHLNVSGASFNLYNTTGFYYTS